MQIFFYKMAKGKGRQETVDGDRRQGPDDPGTQDTGQETRKGGDQDSRLNMCFTICQTAEEEGVNTFEIYSVGFTKEFSFVIMTNTNCNNPNID